MVGIEGKSCGTGFFDRVRQQNGNSAGQQAYELGGSKPDSSPETRQGSEPRLEFYADFIQMLIERNPELDAVNLNLLRGLSDKEIQHIWSVAQLVFEASGGYAADHGRGGMRAVFEQIREQPNSFRSAIACGFLITYISLDPRFVTDLNTLKLNPVTVRELRKLSDQKILAKWILLAEKCSGKLKAQNRQTIARQIRANLSSQDSVIALYYLNQVFLEECEHFQLLKASESTRPFIKKLEKELQNVEFLENWTTVSAQYQRFVSEGKSPVQIIDLVLLDWVNEPMKIRNLVWSFYLTLQVINGETDFYCKNNLEKMSETIFRFIHLDYLRSWLEVHAYVLESIEQQISSEDIRKALEELLADRQTDTTDCRVISDYLEVFGLSGR